MKNGRQKWEYTLGLALSVKSYVVTLEKSLKAKISQRKRKSLQGTEGRFMPNHIETSVKCNWSKQ